MAQNKFLLKNMARGPVLKGLAAIYPETDVSAMEVFSALLGTSGEMLSAINSALSKKDLSQARLRLLMTLRQAGRRGLHPCELAESLGIERASVTSLLDAIEREGFAKRLPFEGDRRSIMVAITAKGTRLIDSLAPVRLRKVSGLMACLSAAERHMLVSLLDRIHSNMPAFRKI